MKNVLKIPKGFKVGTNGRGAIEVRFNLHGVAVGWMK
jgi:hypothetical protein